MGSSVTFTSSDGRVDVVQAPEGLRAETGGDPGYQQDPSNHADEIQDVVSIGIPLSTAEKLQKAEDDIELMKILGIDEQKARELVGQYQLLPGEDPLKKEDYYTDAVREVVIDMLSAHENNEDTIAVFRTFETRLGDKIREKESDPQNQQRNNKGEKADSVEPSDNQG